MKSSPLYIIMHGSRGRMGQAILACAHSSSTFHIAAEVDQHDNLAEMLTKKGEVVIDFSTPAVTDTVIEHCLQANKPLVIGTTGHHTQQRQRITEAAKTIPIVFSPNFSIGVNTLFWLTQKAVEILGADFDLEVLEMHHRFKQDAPSGTAWRLAEILTQARQLELEKHLKHGREGILGERPLQEIGMHSLRGGDVVGDHTVIFAGEGERLELTHRASSRNTFAWGALRAAQWVVSQPPGLYSMQDVLGLNAHTSFH